MCRVFRLFSVVFASVLKLPVSRGRLLTVQLPVGAGLLKKHLISLQVVINCCPLKPVQTP